MIKKQIATSCIVATLAMVPATRAAADADALVGGIVGGIIGGAIVNNANKNRTTTTKRVYTSNPGVSSATREQNRQVQVALNYFGYPVGTPDGVIGARSRAAIGEYQATLGYPPTGQLTQYEESHLLASYNRAIAGGPMTMQQAAQNPMGLRGLLITWRDEAMGVAPPVYGGGIQPVQPVSPYAAAPMMVVTPAPAAPAVPEAPVLPVVAPEPAAEPAPAPALPVMAAEPAAKPAAPGLPSFMGGDTMQASLASHCNKVSLMTSTNGGFTTVASMNDPSQALGEQFCLARTYAISQGEELASRIQGYTPAQIAEQCAGFAPAMQDLISAVSIKSAEAVEADVQGFALGTGLPPAQLEATAKICLSVGYRTDDMDVAIGSALLLATLGDTPYAELLGHHLSQGFGVAQRPDLALGWYDIALNGLASGVTPVFAPGQPERAELIRRAAYKMGGRADAAPATAPVPAAMPSFNVAPAPAAPAAPVDDQSALPAPDASVVATAAPAEEPQVHADPVAALPLAARLPFMLFRN